MRVSGVDPSLTSTGLAVVTATGDHGGNTTVFVPGTVRLTTGVIKSDVKPAPDQHPAVYETNRVADIVEQVCKSVWGSELVLVESPAYASKMGKAAERAHLYFALLAAFTVRRIHFDTRTPAQLKKQVTGNGRADKHAVLDAVRAAWGECGWVGRGWVDGPAAGRFDRADAGALAWMAAVHCGYRIPANSNQVIPASTESGKPTVTFQPESTRVEQRRRAA